MRDRAELPIPAQVRNRLMFALPLTTLCCLLIGSGATPVRAQATPQVPAPTTPTTPPVAPPVPGGDPAGTPAETPAPDATAAPVPQTPTSLRVVVLSTEAGAPFVFGAAVRLDSETERPHSRLTNLQGNAQFDNITDGVYTIIVTAPRRRAPTPVTITVKPNVANVQTIFVSPLGDINLVVNGTPNFLDSNDYSISYTRDHRFMRDFPFDAANHQDLNHFFLSVPGVAYDGGNNYFARGDGAVAGTTMIDNLMAPENAQGRGNSLYLPQSLSSFRAIVGNFAPEYAGNGMVTILNTTPIPTQYPTIDLSGRVGSYNTAEDYLTFGTRAYSAFGKGNSATASGKRTFANAPMGYTFSLSQRTTDNTLDPPQAGQQTVSNFGTSNLASAKFNFRLPNRSEINALINYSTGRTDIADRTGLPFNYNTFGQGYGFAGTANSFSGIGSQQDEGKSDLQKDNNLLTVVGIDSKLPSGAMLKVAVGADRSTLNISSATPLSVNLLNLPGNYSTEYKPFVNNDYQTTVLQADITAKPQLQHQFKLGVEYQDIIGNEAYQFVPGSQLALDALHALDPRLAASGGTVTGGVDSLGLPVYAFPTGSTAGNTPVLISHRTGSYAAGYIQDTWKFRPRLTINYGARLDSYTARTGTAHLDPVTGFLSEPGHVPSLSSSEFSPRLNGVLEFPQGPGRFKVLRFLTSAPTLARFGYNHLFSAPGMNQGNIIGRQAEEGQGGTQTGQPAQPQTTDQVDVNIERQLGVRGKLRFGFYSKSIKNYLESEQLIPGLQSDMLSVFNQGNVQSDGADVTIELFPGAINDKRDLPGNHLFVTYENSRTHPTTSRQLNNLGAATGADLSSTYSGLFGPYVDGDQSDTVSFGFSRRQKDGSSLGLSGYFGTGLYESAVRNYTVPVRRNSTRDGYSELNLRYSTGPRFLKKTSAIQLEVANLLNSKERIDYLGAYGGTRFQQGTRVFLNFAAHL